MLTRIHLDQDLGGLAARSEEIGGGLRAGRGIHAERHAGQGAQVGYARQPIPSDHGIRNADIVETGAREAFRFAHGGHGDPARARLPLLAGQRRGLVRFDVRTQANSLRVGAGLHGRNIRLKARLFDQQAGRGEIVQRGHLSRTRFADAPHRHAQPVAGPLKRAAGAFPVDVFAG